MSSQPTPCSPEVPTKSASSKKFAGAGGRVDDRPAAVDEPELLVVPLWLAGSFVLAVPDLDRILGQRSPRALGGEDELDHLPVALVQVVPVVERVEEPVLKREHFRASASVATWAYTMGFRLCPRCRAQRS